MDLIYENHNPSVLVFCLAKAANLIRLRPGKRRRRNLRLLFAKRVDSFPLGAGRWRFDSSRHAECHQRNIPLPPEAFGCGDRQANSPGFISQGNRLSCQSKIATDFHYMETGLFCGVQSKWKTRAPSPERSGGPKAARKRRHWNESCGGVRTGKPNKLAGPRVWSRFNGSRNLALCGE